MSNDYIYESPDGGKTVTRRKFGEKEKEIVVTTSIDDDEPDTDSRFKSIKKKLMTAQLRAHWFKDHENEHILSEVADLVEELEQSISTAP